MSGFQYGSTRYGSARWSAREPRVWSVDGLPLLPDSVEIGPLAVTVAGLAPRSRLDSFREQLGERVGDYRERQQFGGLVAVEPNDGGDPIHVEPPSVWQPPEEPFEGVVESFSAAEEPGPEHRRIEIGLRRTSVPLPDGELTEPDQTQESYLGFRYDSSRYGGSRWSGSGDTDTGETMPLTLTLGSWGQLALPAEAIGQVSEGGETGGETLALPLDLRPLEARAIRAAARTGAIVTRTVSGGDDVVRDTSDGEQTATVTAHSTTIADGTYGIRGWSIQRPTHGQRPFTTTLDLIKR